MKKLALTLAIAATIGICPAYAQDNIFGGVEVDNTVVTSPPAAFPAEEVQPPAGIPIDMPADTTATTQKLQDALINLESAQVEIRKQLSVVQQKFTDVDKNYKMVKAERKSIKRQIKTIEKSLSTLEKTKKKIRREMATK